MSKKKTVALFINPSYDTKIQTLFVDNLKKTINDIGWLAVTLCNRKVIKDHFTIAVEKQRLSDYKDRLFAGYPAWLDEEVAESYIEQELIFRNQDRKLDSACIRNGLLYCSNIMDIIFQQLEPAVTFLENKVYFFTSMGWLAANYYDSKTYVTEKSPLMNIWLEEKGFFSETGLAESFSRRFRQNDDYCKVLGERVLEQQYDQAQGFRDFKYDILHTKKFISEAKRPIIFFPFDNAHGTGLTTNTHPQKICDYKSLTPRSILERSIEAAQKVKASLVIKSHPSYKLSEYFPEYSDYFYDTFDVELLLKHSDIVVGMLSKTLFHALMYKKQVVSLTDSALSYLGFTHIANEADDWSESFNSALQAAKNDATKGRDVKLGRQTFDVYLTFLGWSSEKFFYDFTNFPNFCRKNIYTLTKNYSDQKTSQLEMVELRNTVKSLQNYVDRKGETKKKRIIYFDVSRLMNKDFKYTGINSFMDLFFKTFKDKEDTELIPVLSNSTLNHKNHYPKHEDFEKSLESKVHRLPLPQPSGIEYEQYIYFSPQDALPSQASTPNYMRILFIHDIFLYNTNGFPTSLPARENFRHIIQSIDVKRDFIVCNSEYTRQSLLSMFPFINPRHVITVYLFISKDYYFPSADARQDILESNKLISGQYIVLLYQVNQRKNWHSLLNLLGKMVFENKFEGQIAIICDESKQAELKYYLEDFFLGDLSPIHFVDSPNDGDLAALYSGACFTIYPSLYEGFGLPALEAMAAGCPVLAHSGSSIIEVCGDAAMLVDMTSPAAIEKAIIQLWSSTELREAFIERGNEQAKKFTEDLIMDNHAKAFDKFWVEYLAVSEFYHRIKPYEEPKKIVHQKQQPVAEKAKAPTIDQGLQQQKKAKTNNVDQEPQQQLLRQSIDMEQRFKEAPKWKRTIALYLLDRDRLQASRCHKKKKG